MKNDIFNEEKQKLIDNAMPIVLNRAGELIKKLRTENNLSIRDLSRISGVSIAVISDIECFKSLPKIEVLLKLAMALKLSFEHLFHALWFTTDNFKWAEKCGKTWKKPTSYMTIFGDDAIISSKEIPSEVFAEHAFSLSRYLAQEGLTTADMKNILEYIEYLKYKRNLKKKKK